MKKAELKLLEKIFAKEICGDIFQTKSKMAKKLEEEGYIVMVNRTLGNDRFGAITVSGYRLTLLGNATYCTSDLCLESPE